MGNILFSVHSKKKNHRVSESRSTEKVESAIERGLAVESQGCQGAERQLRVPSGVHARVCMEVG
jgi:hypothetical protein